jgi:signal transduction histidine kinase
MAVLSMPRAGWAFEVIEEGGVCEPAPASGGGHGLGNLAARARELGGDLQLTAAPCGGVHVRLFVPAAER